MPNPQRQITHNGKTQGIHEWAAEMGIPAPTIRSRLDELRWDAARALTTPVDKRFSQSTGRPPAKGPRPCPVMRQHASGRAFCRWKSAGVEYTRYLGRWGSADAKASYRRFQAEWAAGLAEPKSAHGGATVAELIEAYLIHANGYYLKSGKPTSELHVIKSAMRELAAWCADKLASEVRRDDIEGLQTALANRKLARKTVNEYIARIQRLYRWAAGKTCEDGSPLVAAEAVVGVCHIRELAAGRSKAKETPPKRSVPWADVAATFPHLSPIKARRAMIEDAIRVQWLSGMRPGEVLQMRPMDLDKSGSEWKYSIPDGGKGAHLGKAGVYWLGPRVQAILAKRLKGLRPDAKVFPLKRDSYRRAVKRGCRKAKIAHWHPHQIRHSRATEVGKLYESDKAAAHAIGNTEDVAREIYRDDSGEAARRRIARTLG